MTVYMPIVKAKEGEFRALENIPAHDHPNTRPIIEALPGEGHHERTLYGDALNLAKNVVHRIPDDLRFAIDCRYLVTQYGRPDVGGAVRLVFEAIGQFHYAATPVFRLTDDPDDLDDVAQAVQEHQRGACLRLPWTGPRHGSKDAKLSGLLRRMGLAFRDVDLLVDLWAIESDHAAAQQVRCAREALAWAAGIPWRSVTLAGGAFPPPGGVSAAPMDAPVEAPRRDAGVWLAAVSHAGRHRKTGYADYGVASPRKPSGRQLSRHPKLCYTVDDHWKIYRCAAGEGEGAFDCFRKVCQAVVNSDDWPSQGAAFSWGDRHIEQFAAGASTLPNTRASWRACGQSHHLAMVRHRLDHLRRP